MKHVRVQAPHPLARRIASASARSSPRTRRTRTRPSSPATSTTARSPSTARTRDPRAFNFDGEFNIANRGIIEFIEVLKLDVAFLYDLLGASQEHKIKPKKFAQTDIDEVIIGHTNEAEYKKLLNNEFMEALRDRTVKIDIPYITQLAEESKIYEKDYNAEQDPRQAHRAAHAGDGGDVGGADAARGSEEAQPHAAAEAEALRRQDAARLHRRTTSRSCARRRTREGLDGISPRYIQDKISNALVSRQGRGLRQPVHGAERARGGPAAPLADHQRRAAQALQRAAGAW